MELTEMSARFYSENLDVAKLKELQTKHEWIVKPIYTAVHHVQEMPFFEWVNGIKIPQEFKPVSTQIYFHSVTFPKVMGIMMSQTPLSESFMLPFYAEHAYTEAPHHQMLMDWMLQHKILKDRSEINQVIPTPATNACINIAYQLANEGDREKWLVTINSGIELCSNQFFKVVAPKMRELGAGHEYFDVHVEADEHHSIMGLEHVEQRDPNSLRGRILISKALESISLWAAMLHSWIGQNVFPLFDLDGNLRKSN